MVSEYLHTGFGVRVVCRFELQFVEAESFEEVVQDCDEVRQAQVLVSDDSLHLVELRQVGRVQGLVAEHLGRWNN